MEQRRNFQVPRCPDIERSVLGLVNVRPAEVVSKLLSAGVSGASFYVPAHRIIWRHVLKLHDAGQQIDAILLATSIEDAGELDAVGGTGGLADVYACGTSLALLDAYIEQLLKVQGRREYALAVHELHRAIGRPGVTDAEVSAAQARLEAAQCAVQGRQRSVVPLKDAIKDVWRDLERQMQLKTHIEGVRTGFAAVDDALGGLKARCGYYLVAARPAVGKTSMGLNIAVNVASRAGKGAATSADAVPHVLFVTGEMSSNALTRRMLSAFTGVSWQGMCRSSGELVRRVSDGVLRCKSLNINIMEALPHAEKTVAEIRRHVGRNAVSLVIVDYLQIFRSLHEGDGNRVNDLERVSGAFRELARGLSCPVLLLAQLNREVAKQPRPPMLTDLRGSGSLEQDAEAVMLLHRPELYADSAEERKKCQGKATLIIAKNRNGKTCDVPLRWSGNMCRFTEEK